MGSVCDRLVLEVTLESMADIVNDRVAEVEFNDEVLVDKKLFDCSGGAMFANGVQRRVIVEEDAESVGAEKDKEIHRILQLTYNFARFFKVPKREEESIAINVFRVIMTSVCFYRSFLHEILSVIDLFLY